jgi:hypothetical protein
MFSSVGPIDEYMSENPPFQFQDFYINKVIWLWEIAHSKNMQWIKFTPLRFAILTTDVGVCMQLRVI